MRVYKSQIQGLRILGSNLDLFFHKEFTLARSRSSFLFEVSCRHAEQKLVPHHSVKVDNFSIHVQNEQRQ